MAYIVTIVKVEEVAKIQQGEHGIIGRRPYTDEEIAQANSQWRSKIDNPEKALKEVWGYEPDLLVTKTVETKLYQQQVDDLILSDVIRAVNGLNGGQR